MFSEVSVPATGLSELAKREQGPQLFSEVSVPAMCRLVRVGKEGTGPSTVLRGFCTLHTSAGLLVRAGKEVTGLGPLTVLRVIGLYQPTSSLWNVSIDIYSITHSKSSTINKQF